jgi:HEAT repeat protein
VVSIRWIWVTAFLASLLAPGADRSWVWADPETDAAAVDLLLSDENLSVPDRDEAARRLLQLRTDASLRLIQRRLADFSGRNNQIAVARAIADSQDPSVSLVDALFALLGSDRQLSEAAARGLAAYKSNPAVLNRLITVYVQDRNRPYQARAAVVRRLGAFNDRRAAEALISILTNPESAELHPLAVEALAELAPQPTDLDTDGWIRWWTTTQALSDQEFRQLTRQLRSDAFDRFRREFELLTEESERLLTSLYGLAHPDQRPRLLMQMLRSVSPQARALGAQLVIDDARAARDIPIDAMARLRDMIADSSPLVRRKVADCIRTLNDTESLDRLLARLKIEPDPRARAAQAAALGPINDLRAVTPLLDLLSDDSTSVAAAAAESLRQLGPRLRDADPALARNAAQRLREALDVRAAPGSDLRTSLVGALVPLRQADLLPLFKSLLDRREPATIRIQALKGISELGDRDSADRIAGFLDDPDRGVRLEAVRALGATGAFAYAESLRSRLGEQEADPSVREEAWRVLVRFFPEMSLPQLATWEERLQKAPEQRLPVLLAMRDKLRREGRQDDLAEILQKIAETRLRGLSQPAEAVADYREALDIRLQQQPAKPAFIAKLTEDLLVSLLFARQFEDAIRFASESIVRDRSLGEAVGREIRKEAERLTNANDLQAAQSLISLATAMSPPLAPRYRDELAIIEREVRRRQAERDSGSSVSPDRGAARTAGGTIAR